MQEVITDAVKISERHQVHLMNPASGSPKVYASALEAAKKNGADIRISDYAGHIDEVICEILDKDPYTHIVAYGGDGTVFETVNGIMNSGKSETASFSVYPTGSGNDFSSYVNKSGDFPKGVLRKIDLIKVSVGDEKRYFANMMNIGFDCAVVHETYALKKSPLFRGSAAYIAGVVKVLAAKRTTHAKITLETENGTVEKELDMLLSAVANSKLCGGGFRAAPLAMLDDGLMDVLVVNDLSRLKFISVVGEYKKGTYVSDDGRVKEQFKKIISYEKCRAMTISGAERYCLDGEIFPVKDGLSLKAEVVPKCVWVAAI